MSQFADTRTQVTLSLEWNSLPLGAKRLILKLKGSKILRTSRLWPVFANHEARLQASKFLSKFDELERETQKVLLEDFSLEEGSIPPTSVKLCTLCEENLDKGHSLPVPVKVVLAALIYEARYGDSQFSTTELTDIFNHHRLDAKGLSSALGQMCGVRGRKAWITLNEEDKGGKYYTLTDAGFDKACDTIELERKIS